jgi:hypothetical protein
MAATPGASGVLAGDLERRLPVRLKSGPGGVSNRAVERVLVRHVEKIDPDTPPVLVELGSPRRRQDAGACLATLQGVRAADWLPRAEATRPAAMV